MTADKRSIQDITFQYELKNMPVFCAHYFSDGYFFGFFQHIQGDQRKHAGCSHEHGNNSEPEKYGCNTFIYAGSFGSNFILIISPERFHRIQFCPGCFGLLQKPDVSDPGFARMMILEYFSGEVCKPSLRAASDQKVYSV